uniref:GB1/RHD3-type G domain-containing protein n=3 Tax=Branchiostoma floridae TaxID=7739 RepID=C3ZC65_BRAFL|eukprot:XP_002593826.1 hypothetical protein BRAFLDRAFT_75715 [Branchiostoma floridae]
MASAQCDSLSPRSKLYLKIGQHLSEKQVKNLKTLLSTDHHIAKGITENATPNEIFSMLEDDGKLGEGNLGLLKDLLTSLNESQLAKEVEDLERVQTDISELHEKRGFKVEELKPKEGREAVKGSSIPLILPNDRKYNASTGGVEEVPGVQRESLQVVPEALKLLEGIEEPVSVLAICGPSRTGKSYILSRLLGTADAFELGHRMDPQTFGIWMGTKVLRGKDFTIVLLDTEGIDAVGASAGQDASILVLTTLLSSHLIYNSLNVPYKGDLEKLQCFIQLAKGVTVKHGQKTKMSAFREFFPNFLWLLRDVSLKMQDKNRKDMTPTEYLITKVLRRQGDDDDIDESTSDKVGRAILSFFPSVECATLERPSGDREVMNNIAQHTDSLNPEFNEGVHDLVVTLLLKARAKRGYHKGSTVSGEALSIMAKEYVDAVNDPKAIPALDNTWQKTIELMQNSAIEEAVQQYNKRMEAQVAEAQRTENGKVPLEENEATEDEINIKRRQQPTLMGLHRASVKKVTGMFLEKVGHFGITSENQGTDEKKTVVDKMQKRLVQREERTVDYVAEDGTSMKLEGSVVTGGELFQYTQQNKELSKGFCQRLFERLLDQIEKHVESPPPDFDFQKLMEELADARQQYVEQARGPEKWVVLQEMAHKIEKLQANIEKMGYQDKITQEQKKAHDAEKKAHDADVRAKEREREIKDLLKQVHDMHQTQQQTLREMIQQYEKQMNKMKQDWQERLAAALQMIEELQKANRAEQAKIAREQLENERAFMKEKTKKMQKKHADLNKELEALLDRQKNTNPPPKPSWKEKCTIS